MFATKGTPLTDVDNTGNRKRGGIGISENVVSAGGKRGRRTPPTRGQYYPSKLLPYTTRLKWHSIGFYFFPIFIPKIFADEQVITPTPKVQGIHSV
ncbi:hypothetical protein FAZ15_22215 [Sphingobacterium olei]|uniref:Uncharacterized protein n=1 Tax=Sphingobacterium olei TaxID=2571155 RepID=A0A4U0N6N1_9SPHI|nr:hypothetical protein [Sphingobacterium olei]TJZ49415.1 hypothetical protein FAZ15_22215 [Sphingobacterium olei]